jgi:hypothetical protein
VAVADGGCSVDEDDTEDEHPRHWLAELLQAHGVEALPEDLERLPYEVAFSERLRSRLVGFSAGVAAPNQVASA